MPLVGETLRRERLKSGLDLDRISRETKIPARLLLAIEQEEFEKLPGRVFAISFVRQYAQTLGLDEDQVIADLREQQEPPPPPVAPPPPPEPTKRKSVQPMALAIAAGVLLLLFAHALYQRNQDQPDIAQQETLALAAPVASNPAPAPPLVEPVAAPAVMRLVLTANDQAWVTAKRDGRTVFAGELRPNDVKTLDGNGIYQLVVGNAGSVDITLNGNAIGSLGPRGQTRDIQVSPPDVVQITPHKEPLQDIF